MVRVKICGITSYEDARLSIDEGAHALGFNFFPPSPRCITPAAAWDIIRRLPPYIDRIGVFVNWQPAALSALAVALNLTGVQLHGDEPPEEADQLAKHHAVVKALPVKKGFRPESLKKFRAASAILLERFDPKLRGGTGQPWDWSLAREANRYARIVLAGGLAADNVAEAIRIAQPYAIDVATRIERVPGKKDPQLVRELMRAVASASDIGMSTSGDDASASSASATGAGPSSAPKKG
jgi:phosphoribosylanthranilate isomerase